MKTSDSVVAIAKALLNAQKSIKFAQTDAANPYFKSKYADLPTVIDAIKPQLNDNEIVYIQTPSPSETGTLALTTRLLHVSGEWIEDTAIVPLPKADPQGYGSAMTYARRYSLASITGLYQDDDDGNAASVIKPVAMPKTKVVDTTMKDDIEFGAYPEVQKVEKVFGGKARKPISEPQRKMLFAKCKTAGIPENMFRAYIKDNFGTEHTSELYMDEVDKCVQWVDKYVELTNKD